MSVKGTTSGSSPEPVSPTWQPCSTLDWVDWRRGASWGQDGARGPMSTPPPGGPGASVGCRHERAEVSPEVGPAAWAQGQTWGLERGWWEGGWIKSGDGGPEGSLKRSYWGLGAR